MSARSKFAFLVVLSFVSFPFGRVMLPQTQTATRAAVERALPMLQKSAATFVEKRACFSCHHNGLAIMTLRLAEA